MIFFCTRSDAGLFFNFSKLVCVCWWMVMSLNLCRKMTRGVGAENCGENEVMMHTFRFRIGTHFPFCGMMAGGAL